MNPPQWPFVGSEAVARGRLKKHQLRASYRAVFPDVYVPVDVVPTLAQRTAAAWLWSRRSGVIAGAAAAAMHGAKWIPDDEPVEMVFPNARPPAGILTRRDRLADDEIQSVLGLSVTTPVRTAFDIGRLTRGDNGISRLDALGNGVGFDVDDVVDLARRHSGSPGVPRLLAALKRHDRGAQSPRETWLRLLLVNDGYPTPRTQIPVCDDYGRPRYYLDMGWQDVMVAVEYDGDHHRDRAVFGNDIIRAEFIAQRRWDRIRVVAGHRPAEILDRVRRAWAASVRSDRRIR